jgi:hypothetical protein
MVLMQCHSDGENCGLALTYPARVRTEKDGSAQTGNTHIHIGTHEHRSPQTHKIHEGPTAPSRVPRQSTRCTGTGTGTGMGTRRDVRGDDDVTSRGPLAAADP